MKSARKKWYVDSIAGGSGIVTQTPTSDCAKRSSEVGDVPAPRSTVSRLLPAPPGPPPTLMTRGVFWLGAALFGRDSSDMGAASTDPTPARLPVKPRPTGEVWLLDRPPGDEAA